MTPVLLLYYELPTTQDLVNDEFCLQLEATRQITQGFDKARDLEYEQDRVEQDRVIREAREVREAVDK